MNSTPNRAATDVAIRASTDETMRIFERLAENEEELAVFPEAVYDLLSALKDAMPFDLQRDYVLVVDLQPTELGYEIALANEGLDRCIKEPIAQSKAIRSQQFRSCFLKVEGEEVFFDGQNVGRITDKSIGHALLALLYF